MDSVNIVESILEHYGAKGMKWGVRKEIHAPSSNLRLQGITINKDGSMSIKKGSNIQRLVSSKKGSSRPLKDISFASINKYDNAKYIKVIGSKGLLGGGRDTILTIKTTKQIKAPSLSESVRIHSDLMLNNAKYREVNRSWVNRSISSHELKEISKDPTGRRAKIWYDNANQNLTYDPKDLPHMGIMQQHFRAAFEAKGYNAVRDENDISSKIAKSPIIIFSPEKSLKVIKTTEITDTIRKANKQDLKSYKKNGKDWIDKELYGK